MCWHLFHEFVKFSLHVEATVCHFDLCLWSSTLLPASANTAAGGGCFNSIYSCVFGVRKQWCETCTFQADWFVVKSMWMKNMWPSSLRWQFLTSWCDTTFAMERWNDLAIEIHRQAGSNCGLVRKNDVMSLLKNISLKKKVLWKRVIPLKWLEHSGGRIGCLWYKHFQNFPNRFTFFWSPCSLAVFCVETFHSSPFSPSSPLVLSLPPKLDGCGNISSWLFHCFSQHFSFWKCF